MAARLAQGVRRRYYTVKAAAAFGEGFGEGEGTRAGRSGYSARAQGAGALYIGRRRGTSGVEAVAAVHAQCAWGADQDRGVWMWLGPRVCLVARLHVLLPNPRAAPQHLLLF